MLTRISRSTAHALGLSFSTRGKSPRHTHDSVSVTEDTEEVIIDLDVLLLPVYDFLVPWWRNAGVECKRTISPVYNSIQNLLSAEVARITQLLLSLEPSDEYEDDEDEPFCEYSKAPCSINSRPGTQSSYSERPPHRQVSECHPDSPIVIPSSHAAIPTIVVTPCEAQPRETSALVPLQDGAFTSRLTVPCHSKINHTFPPMAYNVPSACTLLELDWRWRNGHWEVLLPGLDDQTKRGIFSRMNSRRRGSKRCRRK